MPESSTSPNRLSARLKRQEALQQRLRGKSYREIADSLGWRSPSSAYEAVLKALEETAPVEDTARLRRLENARLEQILREVMPERGPNGEAPVWKPEDVLAVVRILDKKYKINGLYKIRHEHEFSGSITIFDLLNSPEVLDQARARHARN